MNIARTRLGQGGMVVSAIDEQKREVKGFGCRVTPDASPGGGGVFRAVVVVITPFTRMRLVFCLPSDSCGGVCFYASETSKSRASHDHAFPKRFHTGHPPLRGENSRFFALRFTSNLT